MPLVDLSSSEALENRKNSNCSTWGDRSSPNRVEPITRPEFDAPFRMQPGDSIFTIGSCFARNVEHALITRGFRIPMRELFKQPEFAGIDLGAINNFGTPSIYNEIAWAFGEQPFNPEDHLLAMAPGKYSDLHLNHVGRSDPWDVVVARRAAIREAYRSVVDCSVAIVTLGLAEVWRDTATGYYLNRQPMPSQMREFPDRFRLHVLSASEVEDYLERAIGLLKKHSPKLNIILTISPVPLAITSRAIDVIVANTYSKSVLRTAAEAIVTRHDNVTYFPSYESIMLSDRAIAWEADLIHVTRDMIEVNVDRMLAAFVEGWDEEEIANEGVAVAMATDALNHQRETAAEFFAKYAGWSARSANFAIQHAAFLVSQQRFREALAVLDPHQDSAPIVNLKAKAFMALGRPRKAFNALDPFCGPKLRSAVLWMALLEAAMALGDAERVEAVFKRYARALRAHAETAKPDLQAWYRERGEIGRAAALAA